MVNYLSCAATIGHLCYKITYSDDDDFMAITKAGLKCFSRDTLETHLKDHSGEKL